MKSILREGAELVSLERGLEVPGVTTAQPVGLAAHP